MDELVNLETTSLFSSIADVPVQMEQQYFPLSEAFHEHSAELPDQHFPEPNSEAMVSALKALQKKIRGLEVDRVIAGERLKHLSEEAQRHPQLLLNQEKTPVPSHPYSPNTTSDQHDVQKRLCRVDTRFREQAVELNGVKERLCEAEAKQQQCFICSEMLEQQHKELLQHQKKILRHLSSKKSATAVQDTVTSPSKRKKKIVDCRCGPRKRVDSLCRCKPVPGVHYRMNMKDVPFLLTNCASPSHSITANYQQLLASMKSHSPLLCGAVAATKGMHKGKHSRQKAELKSLLTGLEEEFGRLTFEHQELSQKLSATQLEASKRKDCMQWEKQLYILADQMESKAEQISIVSRQIKGGIAAGKKTATTYRCQDVMCPRDASLKFLQNMKAIRTSLQQDDLSWD